MSDVKHPVMSVAIRRFHAREEPAIKAALSRLQDAAARQPGYLGEQNSFTRQQDSCELVTVFAFATQQALDEWETSDIRNRLIEQLDRHPQHSSKHTQFEDLAHLLHPEAQLSKAEIVAILIFWILIIAELLELIADVILPAQVPPTWRYVGLVSLNVVLISYIFLPWSSRLLTRVKARLAAQRQNR